jgi:hypothetical protein
MKNVDYNFQNKFTEAELNLMAQSKIKPKYLHLYENAKWDSIDWETTSKEILNNKIELKEYFLNHVKYLNNSPIVNLNLIANIIKLFILGSLFFIFINFNIGTIALISSCIMKVNLDVLRNNSFEKWKMITYHKISSGEYIEVIVDLTVYIQFKVIKYKYN